MAMVRITGPDEAFLHPLIPMKELGINILVKYTSGSRSPWRLWTPQELSDFGVTHRCFLIPGVGNLEEPYVSCGGQGVDSWTPWWQISVPKSEKELLTTTSMSQVTALKAFRDKALTLPEKSTIKRLLFSENGICFFMVFGVLSMRFLPNLVLPLYPAGNEQQRGGLLPHIQQLQGVWRLVDSTYGTRYMSSNTELLEVTWSNSR